MSRPSCSSCKQWGGCPAPYTCQVPVDPVRSIWPAIAISIVIALAIASACLLY